MERRCELIVLLIASAIFLTGILSPPSLMDDVDATQAQMAHNMVESGDWVTLHLDGVPYVEKAPMKTSLAEVLLHAPKGQLILDREYYPFASIVFYTNQNPLPPNGRRNNLEYGSNAPGAPAVFITDASLPRLWAGSERYYLAAEDPQAGRLGNLGGHSNLHTVAESGGKTLFTSQAVRPARSPHAHRD